MKIKNIHIIIVLLSIVIFGIGKYVINRIKVNEMRNVIFTNTNDSVVEDIYKKYPNLFSFSEDGECIISMRELIIGQDEYDADIIHDSDGNDCMGYYIITRDMDNNILIDSSHVCDMIDY